MSSGVSAFGSTVVVAAAVMMAVLVYQQHHHCLLRRPLNEYLLLKSLQNHHHYYYYSTRLRAERPSSENCFAGTDGMDIEIDLTPYFLALDNENTFRDPLFLLLQDRH